MNKIEKESTNSYLILAVIAIVVVLGMAFLLKPDNKPSTKLGKAVEDVADGVQDAADDMKPHKSAGEKIGDAVKDAGDNIKDATRN